MQAIILAAGMGKRLKDLTANATKCMVKVNGSTLIERALHHLDKRNLSRIIIVVGYKGDLLVEFIASLKVQTPIVIIDNPIYDSTNNIYSLYLAKDHLLQEDTLLLESDLIFEESVIDHLMDDPYPNLALVAKYESWMDGTVVTLDEDHNITDFLNKKQFKFCDKEMYFKTVNIYKFSKAFSISHYVPFLEAYCKALGNNEYYEQVLKVISMLENPGIKGKILGMDRWYEIDDKQDLDIAESIFTTSARDRYEKIIKRFGGYWRYPSMLDYCYLVNPYYPPKRLVEELQSNFSRLLCDYPSGQEVNSLLAAKYFSLPQSMTVVGNGAAELIKSIAGLSTGDIGIVTPTFDEYPNRLKEKQVHMLPTSNRDYHYSSEHIIEYFSSLSIHLLIIINPDNPSGSFMKKHEMEKILEWTGKADIRIIVDESFMDFSEQPDQDTLASEQILEKYPHLTIIKSISKSYGVPGLRLGVAFSGDTSRIACMKRDVSIWNINSFAEFYLQIWEKYRSDYTEAMELFRETRKTFIAELHASPFLRVLPTQANYLMCEVLEPFDAHKLATLLLEKNILIKDLSGKHGVKGEYVRIAVKTEEENTRLVSILASL